MGISGFYMATGSKLTAINCIMLGSANLTGFNAKRIQVRSGIIGFTFRLAQYCYTTKYISQPSEFITNNKPTRRLLPGCEAAGT